MGSASLTCPEAVTCNKPWALTLVPRHILGHQVVSSGTDGQGWQPVVLPCKTGGVRGLQMGNVLMQCRQANQQPRFASEVLQLKPGLATHQAR